MNENMLPVMTDEERSDFLKILAEEAEKPMALLDGFDDCLLYYSEDGDGNPRAVYCYEDMVESFARKYNTTYTEAVEFIDFNTMRTIPYMTHVGDVATTPPLVTHRINMNFTTLDQSYFRKIYSDDEEEIF